MNVRETNLERAAGRHVFADENSKLRLALQLAGWAVFEWQVPDDRLVWDPGSEAVYGWGQGQAPTQFAEWLARLVPADRGRIGGEIKAGLASQQDELVLSFRVQRPNGAIRWVEARAKFFYDTEGRGERVIGVCTDVHARKQTEMRTDFMVQLASATRSLDEPRNIADTTVRLLGDLLEADRCAYAFFEPDEDVFTVVGNHARGMPAMEGKFKLSDFGGEVARSQLEGRPFAMDDTEQQPLEEASRAVFRQNGIGAAIAVPLKKEGRLVAGVAVHHRSPRHWTINEIELVELAANACWESIERARVAADLRASERRLRLALTSARMIAWEVDLATGKAEVLENAAEIFGLPPDSTLESPDAGFALMHPEDEAAHRELFARTAANGSSHVTQFRMLRRDGPGVIWIEERAYAIVGADGRPTRLVGIMIDITDRKRAEAELSRAHALLADNAEHLHALVQQRTMTLQATIAELEAMSYSIAHDLRGPLRSLEGFARILLEEHSAQLPPRAQDLLHRLARAAERMDRLTRDVLTYSRVSEAAAVRERVEPEPILRDLVDTYPQLGADQAVVELTGPFPPVVGNLALVTQVFSNLLINAVKFVAPGVTPRVQVTAERRGERARFSIADNGIGVPPKQRERIFGIFERVAIAYEGTGIGLAIAKKAVDRMDGAIGVEPRPEGGSVFWVELLAAKE